MKKNLLKRAAIVGFIFTAFITTTASAFTAVTSGNWSSATTWGGTAPGTTVSNQDISIPSGITVTLDEDVSFGGLLNSFSVNGTLSSSTSNSLTVTQGTFSGNGTVTINRIMFSGILTGMSYSGTMTVHHFENSGATLTLAAILSVSDTLNLDAGSISLGAGANLSVMSNSTIRVNGGTMTIGGGIFNSSSNYNVQYVGATKTSGIEINTTTLADLYVDLTDNTQTLSLGGNLTVNGNVHLDRGKVDVNGKQFRFNGDLMLSPGSMFVSNATSTITVGGSTSLTDGLTFDSGAAIGDLVIDHSGSDVKLMSGLSVTGSVRLMNGALSLEAGGALVMSSGSVVHVESGSLSLNSGTFSGTSYNVEYMGGTMNSGVELTATTGLNDVTVHTGNSTDVISLNNDVTVNGALNLENGKMNIAGHKLMVDGTLNQLSSSMFMGSSTSEMELNLTSALNDTLFIDGAMSSNTLKTLLLNIPTASTMYLGGHLEIATELNMTSGKLDLGSNDLIIQSTASITGYDENKYIVTSGDGKLQMHVNSASTYVTFPVGLQAGYSPASIQQTGAGTSGDFMVKTISGVYANGGSTGWNSADHGSVVNRSWMVSATSGVTINTNVKFGWTAASEVNSFDRNNAYITRYDGTGNMWDTYALGAAMGGPGTTYEMERMATTQLGSFAVVDSAASVALGVDENQPMPAVTLSVYPNPSTEIINIEIANSDDMYQYELIDMTGKTINAASNKNTVNTFNVASLSKGFYFIKATNLTSKHVITKRFVKS